MKALVLTLLATFSIAAMSVAKTTAPPTPAPVPAKNTCDGNVEGGDPSPWPWGMETKFPWLMIRGAWVTTDDCGRAFVFKPKTVTAFGSSDPLKLSRIVEITEYDPEMCKIIATGSGYEAYKIVRATMVKKGSGETYDLTLRAFGAGLTGGQVAYNSGSVVLTVSPHGEWLKRKTFEMQKMSDHTQLFCYDDN